MHKRRGIALMLVMIAILVTGTMAVAYFGSTDNSIAIGTNIESAARARAVAESGLEVALAILETDTPWQTEHINGVLLSELPIGEGIISISIVDANTELPPTEETSEVEITITSTVNQVTQTTQAFATVIPNEEEYDFDFSEYAIFATSSIEIDDIASVQSWQASPLSLQSNQLRLGTLATGPLSVEINSPTQHSPLELHSPSNASSMLSNVSVDRHDFSGEPTLPAPPTAPLGGSLLTLQSGQTENNTTRSGFSNWIQNFAFGNRRNRTPSNNSTVIQGGTYEIETLHLSARNTIEIQGDVTLNVEQDFSLHVTKIILADNATLTMHIGGDVNISSSYIGNENQSRQSWMDPSRVQLLGHGNNDWEIDGITTIKAEIYAPQSEVSLRGISTLCGRVAANKVSMEDASRLLYDATLDNGGYADHSSPLYDDSGQLYSEIENMTELDASLISSIIDSISDQEYASATNHFTDWRDEPTARPNDVIFMMLMFAVDTHRWEELVRQVSREHGTMLAGGIK
jgi:hypothetical protein